MMSPEHRNSLLPRVEEIDLLGIAFEEVIDPKHDGWWKELSQENPDLARQILIRAYHSSQETDQQISSLGLQKIIIDSVAFAVRALHSAAERDEVMTNRNTEQPEFATGGDVDGADLQP